MRRKTCGKERLITIQKLKILLKFEMEHSKFNHGAQLTNSGKITITFIGKSVKKPKN